LQGIREIGLHQAFTHFIGDFARLVEIITGRLIAAVPRQVFSHRRCIVMRHNDAVSGQVDCRLDEPPPRQSAEFLMCEI
jgi:hypothetical protein